MKKFLNMSALSLVSLPVFASAPAAQQGSSLPSLLMLVVFVVVFYFLLIRPQAKRAKEQRNLLNTLQKGDDVLTSGGACGTVVSLDNSFVELEIAKGVVVKFQKQAVVSLLPKLKNAAVETK